MEYRPSTMPAQHSQGCGHDHFGAWYQRGQVYPFATLVEITGQWAVKDTRDAGLSVDQIGITYPHAIAKWPLCSQHSPARRDKRLGKWMLWRIKLEWWVKGRLDAEIEARRRSEALGKMAQLRDHAFSGFAGNDLARDQRLRVLG